MRSLNLNTSTRAGGLMLACFVCLFFAAFAPAQVLAQAQTESQRQNWSDSPAVAQAEKYLGGLGMVKARFVQTSADGMQLLGSFYLNRPGKLRFEYDNLEDFIVADGFFIYFYDAALGEQSNAPIGQTLADFLLREDLALSGKDIVVTDLRRSGGLLQLTLGQAGDLDQGSITLGFDESPMVLRKWRVNDAAGNITEVELFDLQTNINLPASMFVYVDPKRLIGNNFNE
jgi:outer membrane lipoprotein-sorting protein